MKQVTVGATENQTRETGREGRRIPRKPSAGMALAAASAAAAWAATFIGVLLSDDPYLNCILLLTGAACGLAAVGAFNECSARRR